MGKKIFTILRWKFCLSKPVIVFCDVKYLWYCNHHYFKFVYGRAGPSNNWIKNWTLSCNHHMLRRCIYIKEISTNTISTEKLAKEQCPYDWKVVEIDIQTYNNYHLHNMNRYREGQDLPGKSQVLWAFGPLPPLKKMDPLKPWKVIVFVEINHW